MKKIIIIVFFISLVCFCEKFAYSEESGIEKVFGGLLETAFSSSEYEFHPGDEVANLSKGVLYYSGYEFNGAHRVLLFTILAQEGSIIVKFPDPDIIQIGSLRLKIKEFDNESLSVEKIKRSLSE